MTARYLLLAEHSLRLKRDQFMCTRCRASSGSTRERLVTLNEDTAKQCGGSQMSLFGRVEYLEKA